METQNEKHFLVTYYLDDLKDATTCVVKDESLAMWVLLLLLEHQPCPKILHSEEIGQDVAWKLAQSIENWGFGLEEDGWLCGNPKEGMDS